MKKLYYLMFLFFAMLVACEKENDQITVQYQVSEAYAETEIKFRDEDQNVRTEMVDFKSVQDIWRYKFKASKGDILYISTKYADSLSSVKIQINVDGKLFKETSNSYEPNTYLILSGTIPY
jgi:hypothetical protein